MPAARLTSSAVGVLAAVGLLAAVGGISGCSGVGGSPASEAPLTGSSIPASQDVTALCAQVIEQAMPSMAAEALIESIGYAVRVEGATASAGAPEPAAPTSSGQLVVLTVSGDTVTACTLA